MSGCEKDAQTELEIMWTNQHGTGPKTNDRVETQVILQYMCQPYPSGKVTNINRDFQRHTIRNGGNRNTQIFRQDQREDRVVMKTRGLHEPYHYYNSLLRRIRNKGIPRTSFYPYTQAHCYSFTRAPDVKIFSCDFSDVKKLLSN